MHIHKPHISPRMGLWLAITFATSCGVAYFVFKHETAIQIFAISEPFLAKFLLCEEV